LFDKHYADQAKAYVSGQYTPERFSEGDVAGNSKDVLRLVPAH
jgi:penicillin amidase